MGRRRANRAGKARLAQSLTYPFKYVDPKATATMDDKPHEVAAQESSTGGKPKPEQPKRNELCKDPSGNPGVTWEPIHSSQEEERSGPEPPLRCPSLTASSFSRAETLPAYTPGGPSHGTIVDGLDLDKPKSLSESLCSTEDTEARPETSLYHIYHTGKATESYSIHKIKDKDIPLPQVDDPDAPNYVNDPKLRRRKPCALRSLFQFFQFRHRSDAKSNRVRYVKRSRAVDRPGLDARTETSPYYVHRPRLAFHHPPRTLRRGGNKTAPTVCLIHSSTFWRTWKLEFGEELSRDGVIDPRGVVSARYGTEKGQDGTLKGYKVRNWRMGGETGKKFHKEQVALRKATVVQQGATEKTLAKCTESERSKKNMWGSIKKLFLRPRDKDQHAMAISKDCVDEKLCTPVQPEEVVHLKWTSPISINTRRYHFFYNGYEFYWKGTATVKDRKFLGMFLCFNHLKLMVAMPGQKGGRKGKTDICLGKYTSLAAERKSGRLELFDSTVERFMSDHLFKQPLPSTDLTPTSTSSSVSGEAHVGDDDLIDGTHTASLTITKSDLEMEKKREHFKDLLMATAICMIIGEERKRELLQEILLAAIEGAQNG